MFKDFKQSRNWRAFGLFVLATGASVLILVSTALAYGVLMPARGLEPEAEEESEVMVEFAPPPEPEPEPEPEVVEPAPTPEAVFRPAAVRPTIVTPDEIPEERPEESDRELSDARDTGPVGGDTRGVPGGTGRGTTTAPPPPPPEPPQTRERRQVRVSMERIQKPRQISGPRSPETPAEARRQGVQGVVMVRVIIDEQGVLRRFEIIRGNPIFHAAVREWLRKIRYAPARRADGMATSWTGMIPARFDARNL